MSSSRSDNKREFDLNKAGEFTPEDFGVCKDEYLIFKALDPIKKEGARVLADHRGATGTFLIRESRTMGMLTIDFVKNDMPFEVAHFRLQCKRNILSGYTWVVVKGSDIQRHVSEFSTMAARPITAENFNDPEVTRSLFALLKDYGFNKDKIIYADTDNAAADYSGYTRTGYDAFNAETPRELLGRSR